MASPGLRLSEMRQESYNPLSGVPLAAGRSLTHEAPTLGYGSRPGVGHYPEASEKALDHISPQAGGPRCSGP